MLAVMYVTVNNGDWVVPHSEQPGRFWFGNDFQRWPRCRELLLAEEYPTGTLPRWALHRYQGQLWLCHRIPPEGRDRCDLHDPDIPAAEPEPSLVGSDDGMLYK